MGAGLHRPRRGRRPPGRPVRLAGRRPVELAGARRPDPDALRHGPPASGKTTIARGLADELGWPIVAKDTIKSALRSALPVADVDTSRHVGRAAVMVLLAVASEIGEGAVLEAVWRHDQERDAVSRLPGPIVEVFCRCDRPTLEARYATRSRPSGYVPEHRDPSELWSWETFEPVAGGWPVIEVDTAGAVDFLALVDEVREALAYR